MDQSLSFKVVYIDRWIKSCLLSLLTVWPFNTLLTFLRQDIDYWSFAVFTVREVLTKLILDLSCDLDSQT